jgi:hypothetical protein
MPQSLSHWRIRILEAPNLLSLDAPCVAVAWQWLVSTTATAVVVGSEQRGPGLTLATALFLAVWLVYMGDRLLDCNRLDFRGDVPRRHRFVRRHSAWLWPVWWIVLAATAGLALTCIGPRMLAAGAAVLGGVLLYCVAVHGSTRYRRRLPKEFIVGTIFSAGVCLEAIVHFPSREILVTFVMLAGLFSLNCCCFALLQQSSDQQQGIGSAVIRFPWLPRTLPWLAVAHATVSASLGITESIPMATAMAMGICGLGLAFIAAVATRGVRVGGWAGDGAEGEDGDRAGVPDGVPSLLGPLADFLLLSPLLMMAVVG